MGTKRKYIKLKWRNFFLSPYLWVGIIIILLGALLFTQLPYMQLNDNYVSIILGFVGIMATFVVISNYAQVKDVENNANERLDSIITENKKQLKNIENQTENKIQQSLQEIETIKNTYNKLFEKIRITQQTAYEQHIRSYYPKLQEYLYIMNIVSTMSIWKNKEIMKRVQFKTSMEKDELNDIIKQYPFVDVLLRIQQMSYVYSDLIQSEQSELINYSVIEELHHSANVIWWSYDRQWNYFKNEVDNNAFYENTDEFVRKKVLRIAQELAPDYKLDYFNYATIAIVSGCVETDIFAPLKVLMSKYENV